MTLIAFLVFRSQELQAPPLYPGVWLALPALEEESEGPAEAEGSEGASKKGTGIASFANQDFGQAHEGDLENAAPSAVAASAGFLSAISEGSKVTTSQSAGVSFESIGTTGAENPSVLHLAQEGFQVEGPLFAINLESTLEPTDLSLVVASPVIEDFRLYLTRFQKDGRVWHRLRLGFFRSERAAREALADLRSAYPDAWVTQIPAEEVVASAGTSIHEPQPGTDDGSTLVVEVPKEQSGQSLDAERPFLSLLIPRNFSESSIDFERSEEPRTISQGAELAIEPSVRARDSAEGPIPESTGTASAGFRFRDKSYKASSTELALLQRWNPSASSFQSSGSDVALSGQIDLADYFLSLTEGRRMENAELESQAPQQGDWIQSVNFEASLALSRLASLNLKTDTINQREEEDDDKDYIREFFGIQNSTYWRQNNISTTQLNIGLLDDHINYEATLHRSSFSDTDSEGETLIGYGLDHSLNLHVLRGEDLRLSVFGSYGQTDRGYHDLEMEEDEEKEIRKTRNPLTDTGTAATTYGGTVGLGPANFKLSQSTSWDPEASESAVERSYKTEFDLDMYGVRSRTGDFLGETFWKIMPTSLWGSYAFGQVDLGPESDREDEKSDISAGADWNWDSGYASLSYWYSLYDNQQPEEEDYDWHGDGLDIGGGIWGDQWTLDASLSLNRSEQGGEWSESTDFGVGSYLEYGYRPEDLPDWRLGVSTDRYQADYIADDGMSVSNSWAITNTLDFSKYLPGPLRKNDSSIETVFELAGSDSLEEWSGSADENSHTGYSIGLKMDLDLSTYLREYVQQDNATLKTIFDLEGGSHEGGQFLDYFIGLKMEFELGGPTK